MAANSLLRYLEDYKDPNFGERYVLVSEVNLFQNKNSMTVWTGVNHTDKALFTRDVPMGQTYESKAEAQLAEMYECRNPEFPVKVMQIKEILKKVYVVKLDGELLKAHVAWVDKDIMLHNGVFTDQADAEEHLKKCKIKLIHMYQERMMKISRITL